jgi:glycosyltransferase involved in cell wall biosynthesis
MTLPVQTLITDNAAWPDARPRLSVLIPFMRDDPCRLLAALDHPLDTVEIVLLDDGTGDTALSAQVTATVQALTLPCRFVTLASNEGRSKGRNRLAAQARADSLLFLDSDMLPDSPEFLATWLKLVDDEHPGLAFGGFSLDQTPLRREHALHRAMALKSDCIAADERRLAPEKYVFTSNLLIRRDVFEAEAFDEAFTGWGWEDVEWAMRVSRRWPITHIDNTATHLGLDTAPALVAKYQQSAANFARVVARHREIVSTYPSYRVAQMLSRAPFRSAWRPGLKSIACADILPTPLRAFSLRLYRAALYADVV